MKTAIIDTYEYHKESKIKGAPATPSLIPVDQTKFVTYNKELLLDLPMYFAERKLIDIEIPPILNITVIVDTETRHQGVIKEAKAWRGFESLPGATDYLAAKNLTLALKTLHPSFSLPLNEYPLRGAESIKVAKKQALTSPFRGLQSIFLQVDHITHRPLTASIPELAPNDPLNERLFEQVKSWEIMTVENSPEVKGFTVGIRMYKRRGEQ